MSDTPPCPSCGSDRVAREEARVVDRHTGRRDVPAGWWCCFSCWRKWDGVCDGLGVLPPDVAARKESDDQER